MGLIDANLLDDIPSQDFVLDYPLDVVVVTYSILFGYQLDVFSNTF